MKNTDFEIDIYKAIDDLDDKYKIPFKMFLEGFKYQEISIKINLPVATVKSRIFFTRRILLEQPKDFK